MGKGITVAILRTLLLILSFGFSNEILYLDSPVIPLSNSTFSPAIIEFMERPHFKYYMDEVSEEEYRLRFSEILDDSEFLEVYGEQIGYDREGVEIGTFLMADHYNKNRASAVIGKRKKTGYEKSAHRRRLIREDLHKPLENDNYMQLMHVYDPAERKKGMNRRERIVYSLTNEDLGSLLRELTDGSSFTDSRLVRNTILKLRPLSRLLTVKTDPGYTRLYEAEQAYRYYIRKYPGGRYTEPALFEIGKLRIIQQDCPEAYNTFYYMFRISMQNRDFDDPQIARGLSVELVKYGKMYKSRLNLDLEVRNNRTDNSIYSRFDFNRQDTRAVIRIVRGYE